MEMSFNEEYSSCQTLFEGELEKCLPKINALYEEEKIPSILAEAMNYSLLAGGKRLRPVMFLKSYEAFSKAESDVMGFAMALEMVHTYSLIHDDLPGMDDDDFRRGKPSNHKKFGVGMAILAGDALLSEAFELMSNTDSSNALKAIRYVSNKVGARGMVAGQAIDLYEDKALDFETLRYIQERKTSDLFSAAIVSGAILAGADNEMQALAEEYSKAFGFAFQITDDILDIVGNPTLMGKTLGKDDKENKLTLVSMYGIDRARQYAKEYCDRAIELSACFGKNEGFFKSLAAMILEREH